MTEKDKGLWEERPDDIVTAGSKQNMSIKQRYEFVKNRKYRKDK